MFGRTKRSFDSDISDDRSSTASHYSNLFGTVTAGKAEDEFLGIPLSTDLRGHSPATYIGLTVLILVLLFKPYFLPSPFQQQKRRRRVFLSYQILDICLELCFWLGIGTALYYLRHVTLYPLLSVVIFTRTSYPYLIVGAHCLVAACSYRQQSSSVVVTQQGGGGAPQHWLVSLCMGFLGYGFGGSMVSDVFMGLPVTALGHTRIVPCYLLAHLVVWYSPYDVVYQNYVSPGGMFRIFLLGCETVDSVTTPLGRISRASRELNNKVTAPLVAGLLAGTGGAVIRYVWWNSYSNNTATSSSSHDRLIPLENAVYKTLGISIIWWYLVVQPCIVETTLSFLEPEQLHCTTYNGSDLLRVILVGLHLLWTLGMECQWCSSHPFIFALRHIVLRVWNHWMIPLFRMGPYYQETMQQAHPNNKSKKE